MERLKDLIEPFKWAFLPFLVAGPILLLPLFQSEISELQLSQQLFGETTEPHPIQVVVASADQP